MLHISKISHAAVFEAEWRKQKLGKISASKYGNLISKNSFKGEFTQSAITYIEGLAGEIVSGEPAQEEFFTNSTEHGNAHEAEAIDYCAQLLGLNVLRNSERGGTNRLIIHNEFACCTPDALLTKHEGEDVFDKSGEFLKVSTLEVKCPDRHHRYIKLLKCNSPEDLKKTEPLYYWQVITQMVFCDVLVGYFGCYSPRFKNKGKVITFNKIELVPDIDIFKKTLSFAIQELERTIKLLLNE